MHSAVKVAKHFVDKANAPKGGCGDMTLLKLIKITYLAHGWMLGLYGKPLISEDVEAWQYGPVIPELYREIQKFGRSHISSFPDEYDVKLSDDEGSIVDQIFDGYSSYTAGQLVALTHEKGTPWHTVTKGKRYGPGIIIPNHVIEQYYNDISISMT